MDNEAKPNIPCVYIDGRLVDVAEYRVEWFQHPTDKVHPKAIRIVTKGAGDG